MNIDEMAYEYRRTQWGDHGKVPGSAVTEAFKAGYEVAMKETDLIIDEYRRVRVLRDAQIKQLIWDKGQLESALNKGISR